MKEEIAIYTFTVKLVKENGKVRAELKGNENPVQTIAVNMLLKGKHLDEYYEGRQKAEETFRWFYETQFSKLSKIVAGENENE